MSVKIRIPTPLQKLTNNQAEVEVSGSNVKAVLAALEEKHPGLRERLYDEKGTLRRFINFYVNDEDIRFLKSEETALKDGDELSIVPAIAGGC
jgi:sulfur-carrier protein